MSNECSRKFISRHQSRQQGSRGGTGTRADVTAARQLFQCVELRLCFVHAPLKEINVGLRSNTYVAAIQIYSARHRLKAPYIFDPLTEAAELSLSSLEFIAQFCRLLGIPLWVLGFDVACRHRC